MKKTALSILLLYIILASLILGCDTRAEYSDSENSGLAYAQGGIGEDLHAAGNPIVHRYTDTRPLAAGKPSELTVASGMITVNRPYHTVDTEGDAATDDLDTINSHADGDIIVLQLEDAARVTTLKNGTGNISIGSDLALSAYPVSLIYDGSNWILYAMGDGFNGGTGSTLLVAAANATEAERNAADFLCDGTSDEDEINTAFGNLLATGGSVELSTGKFVVDSAIILTSYDNFIGQGKSATKITTATNGINIIEAIGTSGTPIARIAVGDMAIGGTTGNETSEGIHLEYVTQESHFANLYVQDLDDYGLYFKTCYDHNWYSIAVNDCGDSGASHPAVMLDTSADGNTNNIKFYGIHIEAWEGVALKVEDSNGDGAAHFNRFFGLKCHGDGGSTNTNAIEVDGDLNFFTDTHAEELGAYSAIVVQVNAEHNIFNGVMLANDISSTAIDILGDYTTVTNVTGRGGASKELNDGVQVQSTATNTTLENIDFREMDGWGLNIEPNTPYVIVDGFGFHGDEQGIILAGNRCQLSDINLSWADISNSGVEPLEISGTQNQINGGYCDATGNGTIEFKATSADNVVNNFRTTKAVIDSGNRNSYNTSMGTSMERSVYWENGLTDGKTYFGDIIEVTVSGTMAWGDICQLNSTASHADADDYDTTKGQLCLIVTDGINNGDTGKGLIRGYARLNAWTVDSGSDCYVSTTAGEFTDVAPSGTGDQTRIIGSMVAEDVLWFDPNDPATSGTVTGSSTFVDLTDTPANYSGDGLKYVRVNTGETGLEFATVSTSGTQNVWATFDADTGSTTANTTTDTLTIAGGDNVVTSISGDTLTITASGTVAASLEVDFYPDDGEGSGPFAYVSVQDADAVFGLLLHINDSPYVFALADKDSASTMPAIAVAAEAGTGAAKKVFLPGSAIRSDTYSFASAQLKLYVGDDGIVTTGTPSGSGDVAQYVGISTGTNSWFFDPGIFAQEIN